MTWVEGPAMGGWAALPRHLYWLFALVAWPAFAWGVIEGVLRLATGYGDGWAESLLLTALAGATIAGCEWRRRESA